MYHSVIHSKTTVNWYTFFRWLYYLTKPSASVCPFSLKFSILCFIFVKYRWISANSNANTFSFYKQKFEVDIFSQKLLNFREPGLSRHFPAKRWKFRQVTDLFFSNQRSFRALLPETVTFIIIFFMVYEFFLAILTEPCCCKLWYRNN